MNFTCYLLQVFTVNVENFTETSLNVVGLGVDCQPVAILVPIFKSSDSAKSIHFEICQPDIEYRNSQPVHIMSVGVIKLNNHAIDGRAFNPVTWIWKKLSSVKSYFG